MKPADWFVPLRKRTPADVKPDRFLSKVAPISVPVGTVVSPTHRNLSGDQRISNIARFANPQIARKFWNVKDIDVQKVTAANGSIDRPGTG